MRVTSTTSFKTLLDSWVWLGATEGLGASSRLLGRGEPSSAELSIHSIQRSTNNGDSDDEGTIKKGDNDDEGDESGQSRVDELVDQAR